ncbi:hypothetical protein FM109_02500 [Vibrio casei]|nr:hypothetical protein FM109_02500 [Vibrio casei]
MSSLSFVPCFMQAEEFKFHMEEKIFCWRNAPNPALRVF